MLNKKQGNYASEAHDLLGFYSKDPFNGGCQVLARLSDPTERFWTNCDERIEAVSTDGKRLATIALLSDGIGPADIGLRTTEGKQLAHYTINGWFGEISFETPQALLMQANGKTQSAVVRCGSPSATGRPTSSRRWPFAPSPADPAYVDQVRVALRAARIIGSCSGAARRRAP